MSRKFVFVGVLYLASVAVAGVLDSRNNSNEDKGKEPEKKPNIVKDYVCLRDGELCHPEFGRNRGLYVSCSNAVAWELQCPKCTYHPINCPTRTLWFDGEKCDWASPKLASQPCIDHFPQLNQTFTEKDGVVNAAPEHDSFLQTFFGISNKESMDKSKLQSNISGSFFFKTPKSGSDMDKEPAAVKVEQVEVSEKAAEKEVEDVPSAVSAEVESESEEKIDISSSKRVKLVDDDEDFPAYLSAEEDIIGGGRIIRLSDPVYTLVDNPDGSGKQVLMRVSRPFVLEDPARAILPNVNIIDSFSYKEKY